MNTQANLLSPTAVAHCEAGDAVVGEGSRRQDHGSKSHAGWHLALLTPWPRPRLRPLVKISASVKNDKMATGGV